MTAEPSPAIGPWHITAAIAGWLVPGLGHYLIGERARGLIVGIAIWSLWLGGTLVGGVTVFDFQEHRLWFFGQMLVAPSVAVEYYHTDMLRPKYDTPKPDNQPEPPFSPAYGRVQEQGLLYTAMAGLLNLLVLIDVLYRDPKKKNGLTGSGSPPHPEASP